MNKFSVGDAVIVIRITNENDLNYEKLNYSDCVSLFHIITDIDGNLYELDCGRFFPEDCLKEA